LTRDRAFAALDGVVLLGEPLPLRLLLASAAILGGIALVVLLGASRADAAGDGRA